MDASWGEDHQHPVAPFDGALDDLAVVRRPGDDGDAPLERVELPHALLATHAHHLVSAIQRVLDHVPPELPRNSDNAHLHRRPPILYPRRARGSGPSESP